MCVRVCVLVFPMLWRPNVPTKIVILVNFVLVGAFFGPHKETRLKFIQNEVFWKI